MEGLRDGLDNLFIVYEWVVRSKRFRSSLSMVPRIEEIRSLLEGGRRDL